MGRTNFLKYHTMHLAWNAYLRLSAIDYSRCFSCPICVTAPETVIFDGVTLGTNKEIPTESVPKDIPIAHIPMEYRVWITNSKLRRTLQHYSTDGLSPHAFGILMVDLDPGFFHEYVSQQLYCQ